MRRSLRAETHLSEKAGSEGRHEAVWKVQECSREGREGRRWGEVRPGEGQKTRVVSAGEAGQRGLGAAGPLDPGFPVMPVELWAGAEPDRASAGHLPCPPMPYLLTSGSPASK